MPFANVASPSPLTGKRAPTEADAKRKAPAQAGGGWDPRVQLTLQVSARIAACEAFGLASRKQALIRAGF
jgi:hypothetical protein